jgi:2-C-methyl-D-erythritol 4-phosphate cytidylyltransferase
VRDSHIGMAVALIVAAGSGERLGADRPKAFLELAGRPMLSWSLEALAGVPAVERTVVAAPVGMTRSAVELAARGGVSIDAVEGGSSRSESVRRALQAAAGGEPVLVHDAARPLLTPEIAGRVIAALEDDEGADAAIAAAPVTDTIKRAGREGGAVRQTLDRGELWSVQTPQVFRRAALEHALDVEAETLAQATDDAQLVERSGGRVIVVPGPPENIKVTTPFDLRIAELLLGERGRFGHTDPA